ncbi:Mettl7b [Symbiodinium natans]|uniref:Mettl7b protein n=1 Tax=Symbiodinium natans TaxID=878477 RepID=A0A812SG74_9DINO|nr:Mettl7b [Symbiodinium natans]
MLRRETTVNCHAGKEPPETAAAETAKGAADDADLDLDDLEGDDDEDDLEVDGASEGGEPEADDFDKDMPEEDRTMRMKICLAGAMARLHTHSEEVSQLAAQLAERGLNKQQAMNSIFYTWMITCYVKIPDADAKAAADGNSDVLKDAQLYEPPAKASNRQWALLETVLKEHVEKQQEAMKKQEQQKAQGQSQQSRPGAGQAPQEEHPSPGSGSKLYMLLALGFIFGIIGLGIMLLMQKEQSERNERDRKKDKKARDSYAGATPQHTTPATATGIEEKGVADAPLNSLTVCVPAVVGRVVLYSGSWDRSLCLMLPEWPKTAITTQRVRKDHPHLRVYYALTWCGHNTVCAAWVPTTWARSEDLTISSLLSALMSQTIGVLCWKVSHL